MAKIYERYYKHSPFQSSSYKYLISSDTILSISLQTDTFYTFFREIKALLTVYQFKQLPCNFHTNPLKFHVILIIMRKIKKIKGF